MAHFDWHSVVAGRHAVVVLLPHSRSHHSKGQSAHSLECQRGRTPEAWTSPSGGVVEDSRVVYGSPTMFRVRSGSPCFHSCWKVILSPDFLLKSHENVALGV